MAIMTHAKFHSNRLMLTLIFGVWASEPPSPPWPGDQLKKPGLTGLSKERRSRRLNSQQENFHSNGIETG